ncbi:MAG TPA: DciA family protein [Paenalcaligenes sp.]|nr:DciA family protein [Paenalcaligenes sp.]
MTHSHRRSRGQPAAHPLQWLGTQGTHTDILTQAKQLIAIEQALSPLLPAALRQACHAIQLQEQVLTLAVPSHHHASRLRQITPRLVQALQKQRWRITDIQLRVQQQAAAPPPATDTEQRTKKLSTAAISAFAELKNELPDGPLAKAIENLIENHQSGQASSE